MEPLDQGSLLLSSTAEAVEAVFWNARKTKEADPIVMTWPSVSGTSAICPTVVDLLRPAEHALATLRALPVPTPGVLFLPTKSEVNLRGRHASAGGKTPGWY